MIPNRRRIVDTRKDAKSMRETFQAASSTRERSFDWNWPAEMREVGRCVAIMYTSDKWQSDGSFEDYKHVAEAPQEALVVPGFLVDYHDSSKGWTTYGPTVELDEEMPKHFAILTELLGIQLRLYSGMKRNGEGKLPRSGGNVEVRIAKAMLGGARMPDSHEPFLFVYTASAGVHCMIFGKELDVEKDGIVG